MRLMRYFHTIRYLKLKQCLYRLYYYFHRPMIRQIPSQMIQHWLKPWEAPLVLPACFSETGEFTFLNETAHLFDLDIWDSPHRPKLWVYNLHYFDALNMVGSHEQCKYFESYIEIWMEKNLPLKGSGWEPYPLSLRIVNWIKWFARGNPPKPHWLESLAMQAQALLKHRFSQAF